MTTKSHSKIPSETLKKKIFGKDAKVVYNTFDREEDIDHIKERFLEPPTKVFDKIDEKHVQIIKLWAEIQLLQEKADIYKEIGILSLFTEKDYKQFTIDGKFKDDKTVTCCSSAYPYAWKIKVFDEDNDKYFVHAAVCKKHAFQICTELMKEKKLKCKCNMHWSQGHEKCVAYKSLGVIGAFNDIPDSKDIPHWLTQSWKQTATSKENQRQHMGEITIFSNEAKKIAKLLGTGAVKCSNYCYKINNWCDQEVYGTIKFNWLGKILEQFFCKNHIRRHCHAIRSNHPSEKCVCYTDGRQCTS